MPTQKSKLDKALIACIVCLLPSVVLADEPRGTFTGRFVFDGEVPKPAAFFPDPSSNSDAAKSRVPPNRLKDIQSNFEQYKRLGLNPSPVDRSLLIGADGGIADIVVWVSSKEIPWSPPSELPAVQVVIENGNNVPRVIAAVAGQTIQFSNRDPLPVKLSVKFNRPLNPSQDVLLGAGPDSKPLEVVATFAEKFPAHYRCESAPWISGAVFVHHNGYVAVTDESGRFSIADLPEGEWEFRAWHARCGYLTNWPQGTFKHTIQSGGNELGTIQLKPEQFGLHSPTDAAQVPAVREPVGQVWGKPIYRDEVNDQTLQDLFFGPIASRYFEEHRNEITPTADEIRYAAKYFVQSHADRLNASGDGDKLRKRLAALEQRLKNEQLSEEATAKLEREYQLLQAQLTPPNAAAAEFILNNWKLQKHLYDTFGGGRILWQQMGIEAFDAMHQWMKSAEAEGDFSISDGALRAKFYSYWTRDHGSFLTSDAERIRTEFLQPPYIKP
jgi:hypothetical protein